MATNKEIAIKVIKEEFPSISEQGINALLANIEIETGFKKFVEIPQDYDKVMANSDLKSMQKNLKSLKGGKKAYDKLSNKEKLGVLYQGDKNAKYAGGIGGLQLTAANYGGLQDFEKQIDGIAATLNMSPEDLYNKAKTDPATAIRLSLVHLRDVKGVDVQELNVTDGKSLRKDYINPYESQGVETPAQAARDTIFTSYTPQTLSSATTIEQPTTEKDDDPYSDENINAAVDKFVDWANSDNPEQAILDAVDKVNNEADKKKLQKAAENAIAQKKRADERKKRVQEAPSNIVKLEKEKRLNKELSNAFVEPDKETKDKIRKAVISVGTDLQADFDNGAIDIEDESDLGYLNEFLKRVKTELELDDIDVTNVDELGVARGIMTHVTETATESLGEQIKRGWLNFDSKIEDVFEDSENRVGRNLQAVGIPGLGQSSLEVDKSKINAEIRKLEGGIDGSKPVILQEGKQEDNIISLIESNPELKKRKLEENLTNQQLADLLVKEDLEKEQEKKYPNRSLDEAAQALEDLDIQEEEEEEESMESLGLKEDGTPLPPKDKGGSDDNESKISGAEKALTGLKAAAGILSLSQALRAPDVETPEISPLVTEALHKQKALAESGLTAKEKGAAMQNLNDAYAGAMKNVLRASGGQRGMFLANQGTVDANRIQGLNQLAAQDAALHRQNIGQYNQLASSVGSMKLSRDMNVEQMRQATLSNNRQILSGVGSNLLSDAISDVSYYMNPNREKTQALLDQLSKGQNADTSGFDKSVETANTDPTNQKKVDKTQVANQKKTKV